MSSDAECAKCVHGHVKAHLSLDLSSRNAIVAEVDIRSAFKASHEASLLLGGLFYRVQRSFALLALDGDVCVVATTIEC